MREIRVLTWNINTGHGIRGNLRDRMDKKVLGENLERIAFVIKSVSPDIVCLQEVDFRWAGTHNVNQRRYLRDATGLPYAASTMHHRRIISNSVARLIGNYIPSIFERYFGTAILSKYPIVERRGFTFGENFSRFTGLNEIAMLLNESKGYTEASMEIDGRKITVMGVHLVSDIVFEVLKFLTGLDIRGRTFVKEMQARKVLQRLREIKNPVILAGDLNTIPLESGRHDFAGAKNGDPDDYRNDKTMAIIRESGLVRTLPILFGSGTADEIARYRTYPTTEPDRVLDYVFVTREFEIVDYTAITGESILRRAVDEMPSDHLPVVATVRLI